MTSLLAPLLSLALLRPPAAVTPRPTARSVLRPRAPPPRAESQYATFEALEAELRGYLGTLNATALAGPPYPLKYTELQRAGRVDLVEGCMKFGGYASVGERLGMPIPPPPPPPPPPPSLFLPDQRAEKGNLAVSAASREERLAAQLAPKSEAERAAEAERKAARAVGFKGDQVLPLRAPSQGDGGGGAAAADDAFSGASAFFRLSGPQRAEVLLLVALWAGGYGRGSAQLFDAATLEPLRWAATTLFFGHVLIAAYGTLFVALPRGLPPVPWALKLVLTGAGGLGELRAIEGGGGGGGGEGGE